MKSIERRFQNISQKNPFWSTYICFAEAIKKQDFTIRSIQIWFNKLVKKDDYEQQDKKQLFSHLEKINKPTEDGRK